METRQESLASEQEAWALPPDGAPCPDAQPASLSPEMARALVEHTTTLLAYLDADFNFLYANAAYVRSSGHTLQELLGRNHFDLFPNEENAAIFRRVRETGEPAQHHARPFEYSDQPARGVTYWDWTLVPVKDEGGDVSGLVLSLQDVTERARAQRAQREGEATTRAIVETAAEGIITIDEHGLIQSANPACEEMFGYGRGELAGRDVSVLMPPPRREEHPGYIATYLRTGRSHVIGSVRELEGVRNDGSAFPLELAVSEVMLGSRRLFTGIVRDITQRKQAEEALRRSEQRYRGLFDHMLEGFAYCEMIFEDGRPRDFAYLAVNDAFEALTGLKDVTGKRVSEVVPGIHEADPGLLEIYGRVSLTGTPERFEMFLEALQMWFSVSVYSPERGFFVAVFDVITERKRAEEALAHSEEHYRQLAEMLPAIVTINAADGRPEYCNRLWHDYTGMTVEQFLTWPAQELVHPDDRERTLAAWEHSLASGESLENEVRLRRHDGEFRWHLVRGTRVTGADGRARWLTISVDVQERRELADELQKSVGELQALVELAPAGIAIAADPWCHDVRVNPHLADMLGLPAGRNISATPFAGLPPPIRHFQNGVEVQGEDLPLQVAARTGRPVEDVELEVQRDDGTVVTLFGSAVPLFDRAGRVRGAIATFVDITDRKKTEAAQRLLAEEGAVLAESLDYETTLRRAARLAVGAFCDLCMVDLFEEEGAVRRVAVAHADPSRQALAEQLLAYVPDDGRWQAAPRAASGARTHFVTTVTDSLLRHITSGPEHLRIARELGYESFIVAPLLARGRAVGAVSFVSTRPDRRYDASDLPLAEALAHRAALAVDNARLYAGAQQVAEDLRKASAAKDEFLGLVSHELRTPITTIYGNAQLLRSRGDLLADEDRFLALGDIEEDADRLKRIVDNMLVLARAESRDRLPPEPILLQHLAGSAIAEHRRRWPDRRVVLESGHALPPANGVGPYVEQVLRNLLGNAEKYSPREGTIDVRVSQSGRQVEVRVLDRGIGIVLDEAAFLFTAFYRSRSASARAAGAGIGLAVCKTLVEAQGGRLWARPREGGGSEFGFALPICDEDAAG